MRQVLDQEYQKSIKEIANVARQTRYKEGNNLGDDTPYTFKSGSGDKRVNTIDPENIPLKIKKDFFGRALSDKQEPLRETDGNTLKLPKTGEKEHKVWVTFHEGFSNAVRKPITLEELLEGL